MNEGDRAKMLEFQKRASRLQKAIMGAARANDDALTRMQYIRRALDQIEGADAKLVAARQRRRQSAARHRRRHQRRSHRSAPRNEPSPPSLVDRMTTAVNGLVTTSPPTKTHRESLAIAEQQFVPLLARLRKAVEVDLAAIEKELNAARRAMDAGQDSGVALIVSNALAKLTAPALEDSVERD